MPDLLETFAGEAAPSAAPQQQDQSGVSIRPLDATSPASIDLLSSIIDKDAARQAGQQAIQGSTTAPINSLPGPLANSPTDNTATAVAKNVATGAIRGLGDVGGFVGNIGDLGDYLVARGENVLTGHPTAQVMAELQQSRQPQPDDSWLHRLEKAINPLNLFPNGQQVAAPILNVTGAYSPETELGRAMQGGTEAVVGALGPGVRGAAAPVQGMAANIVKEALPMAAAGGTGTAVSDVTGDPLLGLAASAAPGLAMRAGGQLADRFVGAVDPATAQLAQLARDKYGIAVTAPQISDNPALRFGASALGRLPFSGAGASDAGIQTAFNRAVSNTFGENADLVTPQVMQNAKARIGNVFDQVAANTTLRPDNIFGNALGKTITDAATVLTQPEVEPLSRQIQNIAGIIKKNNGTIPGASYQSLVQTGSPLDRAINSSNTNVKFYAGQIKDALDDLMQRSATSQDAQALQGARLQYKNMKTIEDLVEKSPTGNISPALLMGAVRSSYPNMAYSGGGDIGDLARIGQRFLKEPPSSGTSERLSTLGLLSKAGGLGMGAVGLNSAYSAAPVAAAGGLAAIPASLLAGRLAGSALRSNALAEALLNRSLGSPTPPRASAALINTLLAPNLAIAGPNAARMTPELAH